MPPRSGFQTLCLIACVVVFGLIVVGGVVRATDSGDGCPDWPLCHGKLIPKTDKHTLIEYSHRATASVAGALVLAIAVWAWRSYRNVPRIFYPAVLTFLLVLFQAGLGGAAVLNDLAAEIVMVHLGTALIILALLALITTTSFDLDRPLARPRVSVTTGRIALLASAGTIVLMLIGAYMAVADYSLACSGWPLCNGEVVPSSDATSVHMNFGHRSLAAMLGLIVLGLVWLTWRSRREAPLAFGLAIGALVLYGTQVLIGAANIWTEIADEVSAAHLAFGTLLWLALAVLNIRIHGPYEWLPRSSGQPATRDLAPGVTP
jgi:cytochrome c oxidase assembly protein subunit 15